MRVLWIWLLGLWLVSCGGSERSATPPASSSGRPSLGDPIAGTTVYDEQGESRACEQPKTACSGSTESSPAFRDQCRLSGFRIMRCGCDDVCTGNVKRQKQAYDAAGKAKACAPAQPDCSPPDGSAAFQDACTESGHKFVVCGCEWLCSGKLKKPAGTSIPIE